MVPSPASPRRDRRRAAKPLAESLRLAESERRERNWLRFGPYLSERQWGTTREDYSPDGSAWDYLPHDHARSRAYRWGEDGLFGITDRQCRLCFSVALWNERDPFLKERLFGLAGPQGNHGEDVKESYFYLDSSPTHSFLRALYKYPQARFPYERLVEESARRTRLEPEFELADTGIFDGNRYFDVFVEYAKKTPDDLLVRIRVENRGPEAAALHVLPTLWFRNTWSWGRGEDGSGVRPSLAAKGPGEIAAAEPSLGSYVLALEEPGDLLFTENETNRERLFGTPNAAPCVKDAFHEYVVNGRVGAVSPDGRGTKAAWRVRLQVPAGGSRVLRLRLRAAREAAAPAFGHGFDATFAAREREYQEWLATVVPRDAGPEEARIARQSAAGLLWSKQFYHCAIDAWLEGDPVPPRPPEERKNGRNRDWRHLYNRDVLSMPDKWEYPYYCAWDLAFHAIPYARIDPAFAKHQLELLLREWYMHPNGQIPAYEWAFSDANPPVHAWAVWRVYKRSGSRGARDRRFLASCFQKLLLNFTWWVNRKDASGRHIFSGGFLGLDNVGVFDRSQPLPLGGRLEQADGTAWMAFYCGTMLSIALELAREDPAYEDMASKFFEHFVSICDAMNTLGGSGLWSEQDGFYYDQMILGDRAEPLRVRSMVGLIPLLAVEVLESERIERLPGFRKRMDWFLRHRRDLARHVAYMSEGSGRRLLAIPSRERLERVLRTLFDEEEFLSPYGVRSLSKFHAREPFSLRLDGAEHRVGYEPGESQSGLFGGNSNWRGPVWFPVNFLLVEALERYHHFYGDSLRVELPRGSGRWVTLDEAAREVARRLTRLFLPDGDGRRPCHGGDPRFARDPHWRELLLFHEYFHADDGRGLGASHQTGWTALVAALLEGRARVAPARGARRRTRSAVGAGPRG